MIIEGTGKFYEFNSKKLDVVSNIEWKIAIKKCEKHLFFKLMNKTKFGAHTVQNLGLPAKDYYLEYAYSSIIDGFWEWKDEFDLTQQLIRIIDSRISTVVKSFVTSKKTDEKRQEEGKHPLKMVVKSLDIESTFYSLESEKEIDLDEWNAIENDYEKIEKFINICDDADIKTFWDCAKEGYKRAETAEIMGLKPKQLDKVKEKFLRQIRKEIESNGKQ